MPSVTIARQMDDLQRTLFALNLDARTGGRFGTLEASERMRERNSLRRDAAVFDILGPYTETGELLKLGTSIAATRALEEIARSTEQFGGMLGLQIEGLSLGFMDGKRTVENIARALGILAGKNDANTDKFISAMFAGFEAAKPFSSFGPPAGGAL